MINVKIVRDTSGKIFHFTVLNHGESRACAAVSMLTINTINSIDYLTDDEIDYDNEIDGSGGFLKFSLKKPRERSEAAGVLLDAMHLGLLEARDRYPSEIEIEQMFSHVERKENKK